MVKQLIVIIVFYLCSSANASVLFEDNFDSQADYGLNQNLCSEDATNYSTYPGNGGSLVPPTNWNMAYSECSYYSNKGHNTIEIDSNGARGGSGKGVSFWSESDTRGGSSSGWASDGQVGYMFDTPQSEVYIRVWVKFPIPYLIASDSAYTKMIRIISRKNHSLSPFDFFNNCGPNFVEDITSYGLGRVCITDSYRYNCTYYPDEATPYHTRNTIVSFDAGSPGFTSVDPYGYRSSLFESGNLGDGDWHEVIYHVKLNSSPGVADGVFQFWIDRTLYGNQTDMAWIDDCGSMETGQWDFFTLGGNCYNHYAPNTAEVEQVIYFDDIVVATTYQEAVDGGTPVYDPPTITGPDDFSTISASVEISGVYTRDVDLPDQSVVVTWTLGEDSGFCVAALGLFSATIPVEIGTNSVVFEVTDSNNESAVDTTIVTRAAVKMLKINGTGVISNATIH